MIGWFTLSSNSKVKVFNILVSSMYNMSDITNSEWDLASSMSELESLGLETPKLNELNDSYEVENLVVNLKQMFYQDYKIHRCLHGLTNHWLYDNY